MEKHFEEGRYGSVEVTARHPTSIPGTYAVSKELMLPIPNSKAKHKIWSRDALIMYRSSEIQENWHIPFLAPLGPEQRIYNVPLDMFQWPDRIVIRTPDCVALSTPGCPSCTDVLIRTHNVPKYLWLELVYNKKSTHNAVTFNSDPIELTEDIEGEQEPEQSVEPSRQRNTQTRRQRVTVEEEESHCIESDSDSDEDSSD